MKADDSTIILMSLLIMMLLISSCKKKDNTNFLECKVNGQRWSADHGKGLGDYPLSAKMYGDTILQIDAMKGLEDIWITIYSYVYLGRHDIGACNDYFSCAHYDNDLSTKSYSTDSLHTGYITIETLDKKNLVVTGTFSFNAVYSDSSKTVNITEGKFSIPLQRY